MLIILINLQILNAGLIVGLMTKVVLLTILTQLDGCVKITNVNHLT